MMRPDDRRQLRQVLTRALEGRGTSLPTGYLEQLASAYSISTKTVRREITALRNEAARAARQDLADELAAELTEPDPTAARWWATDAARRPVLAELANATSIKKAHKVLISKGLVECEYTQFTRQLKAHLEPAVHLALIARGKDKGREGFVKNSLYCREDVEHPNQQWQADCIEVPVRVRPDNGTNAFKPWLVTFTDSYDRAVMAAVLTPGRPTSADVIAALAIAIRGRTTAEGDFIGGIPEFIRWDNGREFVNEAVTHACVRLGIAAVPSAPYSGWQKGKIERFNRTIQEEFYDHLPGAVHGPRTFTGTRPWVGEDDNLLSFGSLTLKTLEYVSHFTEQRVHSAIGTTPLHKRRRSPVHIERATGEDLHPLMLVLPKQRKVAKDGISYKVGETFKFSAPALASWRGRYVEVRVLPNETNYIAVFDPNTGEHICDAMPAGRLSPEQRRQIIMQRNADYSEVRAALSDAERQREEDALIARALDGGVGIGATSKQRQDAATADDAENTDGDSADEPDTTKTKAKTGKRARRPTSRQITRASSLTVDEDAFLDVMGDEA